MQTRPSRTKDNFRDLLATSPTRKMVVNAIRSERQCPTFSIREMRLFETLRDELKHTVQNLQEHAEVA